MIRKRRLLVDGVVPPRQPRTARRPVANAPSPATPQTQQARPGTVPAAPLQRPHLSKPSAVPKPAPRLKPGTQTALIVAGAVVLGLLAQSAILGQILIGIFGVVAIIRHTESRTIFTMAVLTVVATLLLILVQNNSQMAQNFASYAFLLLFIGIIVAFREARETDRLLIKRRRR